MLRKDILEIRKSLRSVGEGASGPRSKKLKGEWETTCLYTAKKTALLEMSPIFLNLTKFSCFAWLEVLKLSNDSTYCVPLNKIVHNLKKKKLHFLQTNLAFLKNIFWNECYVPLIKQILRLFHASFKKM